MASELPLKILVEDIIKESKLARNGLRGGQLDRKKQDIQPNIIKKAQEVKHVHNIQNVQPQGVVTAHVATATEQQ